MPRILLIYPPVAKPGEIPLGPARLKRHLNSMNVSCSIIDANIGGLHFLLHQEINAEDGWTREAKPQIPRHIKSLQTGMAFGSVDHYNRIVRDLGRVLYFQGRRHQYQLGLADCSHPSLVPARSDDLLYCAEHPEQNPFYEYYHQHLLPEIEEVDPEVIGISIQFLSQALCAFSLMGMIQKAFPGIELIAGGGLMTSWMRLSAWQNQFAGLINTCVAGPGEAYFESRFAKEDRTASICKPDFSDFDKGMYLSPGFILPYNTSTGCYWKQCAFCPERAENNVYQPMPQTQVQSELTVLVQDHRPSLIHFLDNALASSLLRKWMRNPLGAPWYGYVRFEDCLLEPDYCRGLKKSGCVMLKLGLESGDQSVLDAMQKGIDIDKVTRMLYNIKEAGILTFVYLLFGTPGESEIEARNTLAYVAANHEVMDFINPALFNMPIESVETAQYTTRLFSPGDLSLYVEFDHPRGWHRKPVRHFLDREFKRHPAVSAILRKTPRVFTSNHAAFFESSG